VLFLGTAGVKFLRPDASRVLLSELLPKSTCPNRSSASCFDQILLFASDADIEIRCNVPKDLTLDDRDLYGGLIRLHVLHHAGEKPLYGHWMIEELRRHGYEIGPGTMYPLLHRLALKGYLQPRRERRGSRYRKVYRITPAGRRALSLARRRVRELFGEMFSHRVGR
jgi:DNA-binding PadR family transcriptional regulator